jgi:hypothetical protein
MVEQLQKAGHERIHSTEKRSCPRYPFSCAAEAIDIQGNTRITGRISDISRNGCYIDTISPFAPKAAVTLIITKDKQSFKTQAKVVYSQIGMGMGMMFTTAEPDQLHVLGTWLAELSGERVHELEAPVPEAKVTAEKSGAPETRNVLSELILSELIILLSRKEILNDSEAKALLQRLFK